MAVGAGRWDVDALRAGAGVAIVFAIPFAVLGRVARSEDWSSAVVVLCNLAMIGALFLGAGITAWRQQAGTALSHGIVVALLAYALIQTVLAIVRLLRGADVDVAAILVEIALLLGAGLLGGLVGQLLLGRGDRAAGPAIIIPMILVLDIGTTTLRAAVVDDRLDVVAVSRRESPPSTPFPGLVEFDAAEMARLALAAAAEALAAAGGDVAAVGITNQRASTVLWDRASGEPIGPALGWQDLRTVNECITARSEHGLALAPNQSATKIAWLLDATPGARERDLCFGTVDTWLAWTLSGGVLHVTDHTNAAVTGLLHADGRGWSEDVLAALDIPAVMLPTIVDSSGQVGEASVLPGGPPIAALVGDQQGSLVGQGCVRPGRAKITFGTGGMLDICHGAEPPAAAARNHHGTFPIAAWSRGGTIMWGVEAIMLSAGSNVEWLRDDLGLIDSSAASHEVAAAAVSTDGVVYVPALLGLGTPHWDYGARGALFGLTRGTERSHVVRAVLEGVAHRGADLVEAAEADTGLTIATLRVDGGMSQNPTFVQALADAAGRPVEVSPVVEATTRGAAFLAGLAIGDFGAMDDAETAWSPATTVAPAGSLDRERWREAVGRAGRWYPELSALEFS